LCAGAAYDKVTLNAADEIASSSFTGGEYWPVTSGKVGGWNVKTKSVISTYEAGSTECRDNVVMTLCHKGTTANTTTDQALYFNAKTEFCRDTTVFNASYSVEKAPLCFKASDPKSSGTKYDSKIYFCNPETGLAQRKCAEAFFDEDDYFCYGAGSLANPILAPYCKGTGLTQYDPREAFCSYLPGSYEKANQRSEKISLCNNPGAGTVTATPLIKYNISQWNWEYCTKATPDGVLRCGEFQRTAALGANGNAGTGDNGATPSYGDGTGPTIPLADIGKVCVCIDGASGSAISKCTCAGAKPLYDRVDNKCVAICSGTIGRGETDRCVNVSGTVITCTPGNPTHSGTCNSNNCGLVGGTWNNGNCDAPAPCTPGTPTHTGSCTQSNCGAAGGEWVSNNCRPLVCSDANYDTPDNGVCVSSVTGCATGELQRPSGVSGDCFTGVACTAYVGSTLNGTSTTAGNVFTSWTDETEIPATEPGSGTAGDEYCGTLDANNSKYCNVVLTCVATDNTASPPVTGTCGL